MDYSTFLQNVYLRYTFIYKTMRRKKNYKFELFDYAQGVRRLQKKIDVIYITHYNLCSALERLLLDISSSPYFAAPCAYNIGSYRELVDFRIKVVISVEAFVSDLDGVCYSRFDHIQDLYL